MGSKNKQMNDTLQTSNDILLRSCESNRAMYSFRTLKMVRCSTGAREKIATSTLLNFLTESRLSDQLQSFIDQQGIGARREGRVYITFGGRHNSHLVRGREERFLQNREKERGMN